MTLSWIRVVQSRFKDVAVKLRDFKAFHPACGQRPSGGVALTEKSLAAQKRPNDKPDAKGYEDENNAERTYGSISPQNRKRAAFDNQPGTPMLCAEKRGMQQSGRQREELFFLFDPLGKVAVHESAGFFDHGLGAAQPGIQAGGIG